MRYYFDWDPNKARTNIRKHGVSIEHAAGVFLDPRAVTIFDEDHSEIEERWATIGIDANGTLLVIMHTFQHIDEYSAKIRIISARKATRREIKQYREENK